MRVDQNGFVQKLDRQLGWRKKEIAALLLGVSTVHNQPGPSVASALTRGAICMLYAHWEGFVREAMRITFEHVDLSCSIHDDLIVQLQAAILLEHIEKSSGSLGLETAMTYIDKRMSGRIEVFKTPAIGSLSGNVSYEVYANLLNVFGMQAPADIEVKRNFINVSLLARRNKVAHGDGIPVEFAELVAAKDNVLEMLDATLKVFVDGVLAECFLKPEVRV